VFHLENRPRGNKIVAWKSKGGGLGCLTQYFLGIFRRGPTESIAMETNNNRYGNKQQMHKSCE